MGRERQRKGNLLKGNLFHYTTSTSARERSQLALALYHFVGVQSPVSPFTSGCPCLFPYPGRTPRQRVVTSFPLAPQTSLG